VLLQLPQISQAVVIPTRPSLARDIVATTRSSRRGSIAKRGIETCAKICPLHGSGYFEELDVIPDDVEQQGRSQEPSAPKGPRFSVRANKYVRATTDTKRRSSVR